MYAIDQLLEEELPRAAGDCADLPGSIALPVGTPLIEIERAFILATLRHFAGDKRAAAQALGCSVKTLYNKLHLYRRLLLQDGAAAARAGTGCATAPEEQPWGGPGTNRGSRTTRAPAPVVARDDDDPERDATRAIPTRRTTCAAAS